MRTHLGQDIAGLVAGLGHDNVHVWRIDHYQRSHARSPLRALLGVYLGLPADNVELIDGEHGRPALAPPWQTTLHFNWSHSGQTAVIVVARGVEPGVDIELLRARPRALELAERFFHPEETTWLAALDDTQREAAFLRLWTAKEAVLKAIGRGIAFGLDRLRFTQVDQPTLAWLDGDDAEQWQLHALQTPATEVGHIAWRGAPRRIDQWTLAADD